MDIIKDIEYILGLDNTEWIVDRKDLVKILRNLYCYRDDRLVERIKYVLSEGKKFEAGTEISEILKNIDNKQGASVLEQEIFNSWYDIISEALWNDQIKINGKPVIEKLDCVELALSGEIIDRNIESNVHLKNAIRKMY